MKGYLLDTHAFIWLQEVLIAKKAWLEVAKEKNKLIPLPKYKPIIYQIAG